MGYSFLNGSVAPHGIEFLFLYRTLYLFRKFKKTFRGIVPPVEQDILHADQQFLVYFVIHLQHSRIDDTHIHTFLNGVIQESGMHGFPDLLISAEAERHIAYTSTDMNTREVFLYPFRSAEKVKGVGSMFLQARS